MSLHNSTLVIVINMPYVLIVEIRMVVIGFKDHVNHVRCYAKILSLKVYTWFIPIYDEIQSNWISPRPYGGFVYMYIVTPFITDVGVYIDATKPKPYNSAMCVYTTLYTICKKGGLRPARPGPVQFRSWWPWLRMMMMMTMVWICLCSFG